MVAGYGTVGRHVAAGLATRPSNARLLIAGRRHRPAARLAADFDDVEPLIVDVTDPPAGSPSSNGRTGGWSPSD